MSKVEKSFTTLGLEGILQGVVSCLVDAEKKAKSSGEIQSLDVSRRGLRQDLYVGKLLVVPPAIMDDTAKIPDPLLKGAVLRLFDGEDAVALEMHRLSSNEFDDLTPKNIKEYKEKVFSNSDGKMGCIVLFQPAWGNVRDFHAFHFSNDIPKLTLLVRHLVFSAYYNPSLSALFDTLAEDAIKLDAVNVTHEHLGPAYEFQSEEKSYPVLDKDQDRITKTAGIMKLSPDEFTTAYLEAAVWTGTDENGNPLDKDGKFSIEDFSTEALQKAEEDCQAFMQMAGPSLESLGEDTAGHLFWLNRNGHGTGFWDEENLSPEVQQSLDKLAHSFGECNLYVSDDGELELTGGQIPPPTPPPGSGHILPKESKWIRLTASALPLIKADKISPEESAVMDELTIQLESKTGGKVARGEGEVDSNAGYCSVCGDPECRGECCPGKEGTDFGESEEDKIATGDAGSIRIPTSPNTGLRAQEDYMEPGSQEIEKEPVHFGSGRMAAFLEKIASEEIANGYTEMREMFKSDFAKKDTPDKESDHEGTLEKNAKQAADVAISSIANTLVDQHHGEYLSKKNLTHLLSHLTNNIKAVFSFLTQQGLIEPFGADNYKIMSRTEREDEGGAVCPNCAGPGVPMGNLGGRSHFRCRNCGSDFSQKSASDIKTASQSKVALTYMHPGQILEQFYPEILKDTSDYPIGNPARNSSPPPLPLELQGEPGGESQVTDKDYSDGGMKHSLGEPGLVPSQDSTSVPLKPNERSIRGPFFSDQFYRIHTDIDPALLTMKSSLEKKTAAAPENAAVIAEFLRRLSGEIASSLLAAFVVTNRPLFTSTPAYSVINIANADTFIPMNPILTSGGMSPYVAQFKALLGSVNSGELTNAINNAWAQSAVRHDGPDGKYLYEVYVRIEKVDLDTLDITYKYITGTKE